MSVRALALHLHCYQPPRENPWLDVVLREANAAPFHDWNARITAECYRPQTAARVLADDGSIARARNLYDDCSFNVGPTLHEWFAQHAPDVDEGVRRGDSTAADRRDGHGTAIAHPYVHAILPLADDRDRRTLVRWGVAHFRSRYGRAPEGMWLPETAVDEATLEALADAGISFTVLAPQQVARVRAPGGSWQPADPVLDPTRPYRVTLPSGRAVTVCVFDGPLSQAVAFDRDLLSDGEALAGALAGGFRDREGPQLLVVATDGETYGHHHRFGEMAVARALDALDADPSVELMTPGEFLARFPAEHEAELVSPSSWSCAHGVGRWSRDCGCSTSGEPGWGQAWRGPLREAVDWLRDTVAVPWADAAGRVLADPWSARDDYVDVLVRPGAESRAQFLKVHATDAGRRAPSDVWSLLELQRHLLMTGTSCGWFFADPASLETAVVLRNAARVVDLAGELLGLDLEDELRSRLAGMRSNQPQEGDGSAVWRTWGRGAQRGPLDVAASWAALASVDPRAAGDLVLGMSCRPEPLPGDRHVPALGPGAGAAKPTTGLLSVTDPRTGRITEVVHTAVWGADGGPHVAVADASGERTYDLLDLTDEVVADLLRAVLSPVDRPLDALLRRAASIGLDVADLATDAAERMLLDAVRGAAAEPERLPSVEAALELTRDLTVDQGSFAAQNLVLALRDRLPVWDADPAMADAGAALRRIAERLRVSLG